LAFIEGREAGLFDRRDVDEDVPPATPSRLNETVAFGGVNHFTGPLAM
jgi:hypothetical protein